MPNVHPFAIGMSTRFADRESHVYRMGIAMKFSARNHVIWMVALTGIIACAPPVSNVTSYSAPRPAKASADSVQIFTIINGTSVQNVQSLAGQLASFLAGTVLPTPRLEVASYSGGTIDLEEAAKLLPPGSIGTLFLQVPFVPVEEKKYKVEEVSKWTTGRIAASGTTAGPQTPR